MEAILEQKVDKLLAWCAYLEGQNKQLSAQVQQQQLLISKIMGILNMLQNNQANQKMISNDNFNFNMQGLLGEINKLFKMMSRV